VETIQIQQDFTFLTFFSSKDPTTMTMLMARDYREAGSMVHAAKQHLIHPCLSRSKDFGNIHKGQQ
jgi:hypothetical protein